MTKYLSEQGNSLAKCWAPALEKVRKDISCQDTALFSGLVAFAGIHMHLWPLWLQHCRAFGLEESYCDSHLTFKDAQKPNQPWLCVFVPFGENSSMMHLQAPGLRQEVKLISALRESSFLQFMKTLDEKGHVLAYNKGIEILYALGHTYANNEPLRMPLMHWTRLLKQWPFWHESTHSIESEMMEIAKQWMSQREYTETALQAFQSLAASLWQTLQEENVLQCGQNKKGMFSFLKFKKSEDAFLGNLAFYGDHQAFWDQTQKTGNEVQS